MSCNGCLNFLWSSIFLAFLIFMHGNNAVDPENMLEDPNSEQHVIKDWNLDQMTPQENKRGSWQNFQGTWGKRDPSDLQDEDKRGSWQKFQGGWGKRDSGEVQEVDLPNSNDEITKRGKWSNMQGSWGKRMNEMDANYIRGILEASEYPAESALPLKRNWSKFAGTWGKRPFTYRTVSPRSTTWSSLRGSWGKRSGNWARLRGVWGKRADEE